MSKRLFQTFALLLGLSGTATFYFLGSHEEAKINEKQLALRSSDSEDRAPASFGKVGTPLSATIQRVDAGGANQIRLKGTVLARRNFSKLTIQWNLPDGVQLVSGNVESNSFDLAEGQSADFEIEVSQLDSENHEILFHVQSDDQENGKLAAVAEYNTTNQELIAKQLRANFLKARERVKSGELRKIVF